MAAWVRYIPTSGRHACTMSRLVLVLTSLLSLVPTWVTEAYEAYGSYEELDLVRIAATPPYTTFRNRQTIRISCLAEGAYSQPYISFWWRVASGQMTWLSDEDEGVSIRLNGEPGNRTVTLDLWLGPGVYPELLPGKNLYKCRATTENKHIETDFIVFKV